MSNLMGDERTIVDVLHSHARVRANATAFTFLQEDGEIGDALTFRDLHRRALAMADTLRRHCAVGDRALILLPTGRDYLTAFFGALYAGVVAVPLFPPTHRRQLDRLLAILDDCAPRVALVEALDTGHAAARDALAALAARDVVLVPALEEAAAHAAKAHVASTVSGADLALLQYTSGSTGKPKGVMVTHANLVQNAFATAMARGPQPHDASVSWLPLFHDMGLLFGMLQPLYGGFHGVLMPPSVFMRRPLRWLDAISRFSATWSSAPNFAFERCIRGISDAELASLDLSRWRTALNAAEPIRPATMRRFIERFAVCGFRPETMAPGYGLAEATLVVTLSRPDARPRLLHVDKHAIEQDFRLVDGTEQTLVCCGSHVQAMQVAIVDPDAKRALGDRQVGEVWLHGPGITAGYWNNPAATRERFEATMTDGDGRHWMRTGDMGALVDGDLVISGRLDDMLIVRGRNIFPQDVENAVTEAHAALRVDGAAVFLMDGGDGADEVAVVAEVNRDGFEPEQVVRSICSAVVEQCDVGPVHVVLIRGGTLPRTSSGKVQRKLTRSQLQAATLRAVHHWRMPAASSEPVYGPAAPGHDGAAASGPAVAAPVEAELLGWIRTRLGELSGFPFEAVDPDQPFAQHAIDSLRLASLSDALSRFAGRDVPVSSWWNHPTPRALARFLERGIVAAEGHGAPPPRSSAWREPAAIVGYACRLPGVSSTDRLWPMLASGEDAIAAPSDHRPWMSSGQRAHAGYVDGIDRFDARFFGISPIEAQYMDPQQRLFLETAWEALERSGQSAEALRGSRTGVFVGVSTGDYGQMLMAREARHRYCATGATGSIIANRLSYLLDLRGPSLAVDTACSSSLVALHLAMRSLRDGECDLAIVAGVNMLLNPNLTEVLSEAGMMSTDARCHTFDARANGYVRGEGCGVVVIRRQSDARARRDNILAVLLGSAVQQDGRTNGMTAPSGLAQQAVLRAALSDAGVSPGAVSYIEAHGTGTALGDPIEVEALRATLDGAGPAPDCWIGSVKAAIGHLEAAAGIAGIIKVLCMLEHRSIPPQANFANLNARIDLNGSRLRIARSPAAWDGGRRRVAGVSSFGFGGTSCHVIVAEPEAGPEAGDAPDRCASPHLAVVSAPDERSLREGARALAEALAGSTLDLESICFTLATGRVHHARRAAFVVRDVAQLQAEVAKLAVGEGGAGAVAPRIVLAFGDWRSEGCRRAAASMAANGIDAYARHVRAFDATPTPDGSRDIADAAASGERLDVLRHQYALYCLLRELGLPVAAVTGAGRGQLAAAAASGCLELDDAVMLASGGRSAASVRLAAAQVPWVGARWLLEPGDIEAAGLEQPESSSHGEDAPQLIVELGTPAVEPDRRGERVHWNGDAGAEGLYALLGALYVRGCTLAWERLFTHAGARRVVLPGYAFQRERYWAPELDAVPASGRPQAPAEVAAPDEAAPDASAGAPNAVSIDLILAILRTTLNDPALEFDDNIFNRGADSISCIEIAADVKEQTGFELSPQDIFSSPTARKIMGKIRPADAGIPVAAAGVPAGPRPLSYSQLRLWFLEQVSPGDSLYNIPAALSVEGELDVDALGRTFDAVVARHAALRSRFVEIDGEPAQEVLAAPASLMSVQDLSHLPLHDAQREALRQAERETRVPFDLTQGPLFRARLLRLSPRLHVALVTMHHIASDGWSIGVFSREMEALYADFVAEREPSLPPLPIQYADYAEHQQRWLGDDVVRPQLEFWTRALTGAPALLALPTDRPRPPVQAHRGARAHFSIDAELAAALHQIGRESNTTVFVVLISALNLLLHAYSGQRDICIGTPVANRSWTQVRDLIGFFVNNLVIRTQVDPAESASDTIRRVRDFAFEAYANQDVPFERVVEQINPVRSLAHSPIFQVFFVLHHAPMGTMRTTGLHFKPLMVEHGTAKFDLTLELTEVDGRLDGWFEYDLGLFDPATIERMVEHFRLVLRSMVDRPQAAVASLDFVPPDERALTLEAGRPITRAAAHGARTAQALFEAWARRAPDRIALEHDGRRYTYRALDDEATRLAHALRDRGVGAECVVAVCQELAGPLVVSLLAILKAGAAYLPLDPNHPDARLRFIVDEARPALVLASHRLLTRLPPLGCPVWDVDRAAWNDAQPAVGELPRPDPVQAAVIVYTSGSTGRPKGVVIDQQNLANRLAWMAGAYPAFEQMRFVQKTVISFIDSITEMLSPLSCGATLCIAPDATAVDPLALADFMARERIDGIVLVPSLLREMLRPEDAPHRLKTLKAIISSGEAMPADLARQVLRRLPQVDLIDCYGSSEVGDASAHACTEADVERGAMPLGPAIDNTRLYVLGEALQPAPVGAQGEICIAGRAVARAYLNRPAHTAERFVPDPFSGIAGARMFRSGDMGRRLADGGIEFLGRRDHQVKLRGFRIELGEVEVAIRAELPGARVVAIVREDQPGDRRLVAYVAGSGPACGEEGWENDGEDRENDASAALKERLRRVLPMYMMPSHIVFIDRLPMTANGKVDRLALPVAGPLATRFDAPSGPTEERLAAIWREVLGIERVGRWDSFFDLGGHSLLAAQALAKAKVVFEVALPMRSVFEAPRLADIASLVDAARGRPIDFPVQVTVQDEAEQMSLSDLALLTDEELDV